MMGGFFCLLAGSRGRNNTHRTLRKNPFREKGMAIGSQLASKLPTLADYMLDRLRNLSEIFAATLVWPKAEPASN